MKPCQAKKHRLHKMLMEVGTFATYVSFLTQRRKFWKYCTVMVKYSQIFFSWFSDALMLINILYNIIYLHIGLPHFVMLKYSQIFFSWVSDALMLINMTLQHRSETLNCPTQDINMFPCQRFKGFNFANVQICNKSQNLILNMKAKFWAKREWKQRHFVSLELFGWVKVHCC